MERKKQNPTGSAFCCALLQFDDLRDRVPQHVGDALLAEAAAFFKGNLRGGQVIGEVELCPCLKGGGGAQVEGRNQVRPIGGVFLPGEAATPFAIAVLQEEVRKCRMFDISLLSVA